MRKYEMNRRMARRVLMFGWEFPPHNSGGLGVACQGIVKALSKQENEITLVLPRRLDVQSSHAEIVFAETEGKPGIVINSPLLPYMDSATYEELGEEGRKMYGSSLIEEVLRYAALSESLISGKQFDVIYAHDWLTFPAALRAKEITGKPLVVHVHSTEFDRSGGFVNTRSQIYRIEKEGMEAADRIIVLSHYMKSIVEQTFNISPDKIDVVHNGIDEDTTPQPGEGRSQLSSLKENGYSLVLFLGRITMQKGLDHLLRAAQLVVRQNPKVLFLVSGSGDMERRMMEFSAELGIAQNVLFTGFVRGKDQYESFRLADVFVMPSISEPFGLAALEAMNIGTPVIVSKQAGVAEAIQHALKVDFWDVQELANKILSTVAHPELRETLAQNGSAEVRTLTWSKAGNSINRIFNSVTSPMRFLGVH